LSRYLHDHYHLSYHPDEEMIITTGVSEGLDIAIRAVVDPGDEVLVAEPCYVSYSPCVTLPAACRYRSPVSGRISSA
jgi:aminotransferase